MHDLDWSFSSAAVLIVVTNICAPTQTYTENFVVFIFIPQVPKTEDLLKFEDEWRRGGARGGRFLSNTKLSPPECGEQKCKLSGKRENSALHTIRKR